VLNSSPGSPKDTRQKWAKDEDAFLVRNSVYRKLDLILSQYFRHWLARSYQNALYSVPGQRGLW
jgi:hypothetical protein